MEMAEFLEGSSYFGIALTIALFGGATLLKKKFKLAILNPILLSSAVIIALLAVFRIDYAAYDNSASYISYLLTPATICLAIPLYENLTILKRNALAILSGILAGIFSNIIVIGVIALIFQLDHQQLVTLLPKSITTAIGMGVSEELGGIVSITIATIILTGVFANISADLVFRLFRIEEPVARGIALGTSGHAVGTAKAAELGETEGAMSGLAIATAGLISVLLITVTAELLPIL